MPSGRCRPSAFGMYALRDGLARYRPDCTRSCKSRRLAPRSCSYFAQLTPSTPGAAFGFTSSNARPSRCRLTWCSSAVNRASLSLRATSRTRSSSLDTPDPALRPGRVSPAVFPLARSLSSPASATARAALFGGFAGTTERSDCPCPFISGLPPQRSLSGPPGDQPDGQARALPVLAHGGSVHALVL